jgi:hypothetical protein
LNNGGTVTWVNSRSNKPAFMQSWTLDVQRELPFNILLNAGYVGSHTTGIWTGLENINQVNPKYLSLGNLLYADISSPDAAAAGIKTPYPGFTGSVAQALRPFPQYTTIYDFYQPTGYNTYHPSSLAAETILNGLSFLGAYVVEEYRRLTDKHLWQLVRCGRPDQHGHLQSKSREEHCGNRSHAHFHHVVDLRASGRAAPSTSGECEPGA